MSISLEQDIAYQFFDLENAYSLQDENWQGEDIVYECFDFDEVSSLQNGSREEEEEEDDDIIYQYFDLDAASSSQSWVEDNNADANVKFITIMGPKEDPYETRLAEALQHLNGSGERGPFVFPYSHDVFFGHR